MGQAKQRGTFEQRRAESIQAEAERMERQRVELAARKEAQRLHDLANPKQAAAKRATRHRLNTILSVALGASLIAIQAPHARSIATPTPPSKG